MSNVKGKLRWGTPSHLPEGVGYRGVEGAAKGSGRSGSKWAAGTVGQNDASIKA